MNASPDDITSHDLRRRDIMCFLVVGVARGSCMELQRAVLVVRGHYMSLANGVLFFGRV